MLITGQFCYIALVYHIVSMWDDRCVQLCSFPTLLSVSILYSNVILMPPSHTYVGISSYRTLAIDWAQSMIGYVMCDLIVGENTNVVHFSCVM